MFRFARAAGVVAAGATTYVGFGAGNRSLPPPLVDGREEDLQGSRKRSHFGQLGRVAQCEGVDASAVLAGVGLLAGLAAGTGYYALSRQYTALHDMKALAENDKAEGWAVASFMVASKYQQGGLPDWPLLGLEGLNASGEADNKEAAKWYLRSAEGGFPEAQEMIGLCYFHGAGVEEDDALAKQWLQAAAENMNTKENAAFDSLGADKEPYRLGQEGLCAMAFLWLNDKEAKDQQRAIMGAVWFGEAAKSGSAWGAYQLGVMYVGEQNVSRTFHSCVPKGYMRGRVHYRPGVEPLPCTQNLRVAAPWLLRAAGEGLPEASDVLPELKDRLEKREKDADPEAEAELEQLLQITTQYCKVLGATLES